MSYKPLKVSIVATRTSTSVQNIPRSLVAIDSASVYSLGGSMAVPAFPAYRVSHSPIFSLVQYSQPSIRFVQQPKSGVGSLPFLTDLTQKNNNPTRQAYVHTDSSTAWPNDISTYSINPESGDVDPSQRAEYDKSPARTSLGQTTSADHIPVAHGISGSPEAQVLAETETKFRSPVGASLSESER
ncbi:uncharacterized protein LAESUDRAFT_749179 [Laetiporus sulphureus 93-53]|uniref:Uncharacterized protein n=1 Tax=Laetiporus sulphureus 93-53 TaxID=1314785 RepID=A0A165EYH0_9APHY|nr:uncharacterized protein LAESUDRAFT_749179 [Laetiporus sulphureus 93-53]KZT07981.1 hypothetical protein LAESUDRAFT_749179 [Laetiporus sulphureus 93-53]